MATWKIRQIFDGDYGCEERLPGQGGNNMEHITRDEAFLTASGNPSEHSRIPAKRCAGLIYSSRLRAEPLLR